MKGRSKIEVQLQIRKKREFQVSKMKRYQKALWIRSGIRKWENQQWKISQDQQSRQHDVTDEVYQREGGFANKSAPMVEALLGVWRRKMFETSLNTAAFRSRLLSIRIFGSTHWSPNWRNQMVLRCFAVSNKTGAGFTDSHSRSGKVVSQALVMFYQTP